MVYSYQTQSGMTVFFELSRRARTRLILRVVAPNLLRISLPPQCGQVALTDWLRGHEDVLLDYWRQAQTWPIRPAADELPDKIWFAGRHCAVCANAATEAVCWLDDHTLAVPSGQPHADQARVQLVCWLYAQAEAVLLPRLRHWSVKLSRQPAAMGLSCAKTFWGVCRPRTGIRLNWRLIGAPDWVVDYVCIHELCHLVHLNHSVHFWSLVDEYTPHARAAKIWLKNHGSALFVLD